MSNGFDRIMGGAVRTALGTVGLAIATAGAAAGAQDAGHASPERFEYRRLAMGVEARLVLYAPTEDRAVAAAEAAYARLREIEWATSDYLEDGALARVRAGAPEAVAIPEDLHFCLTLGSALEWASDGAFVVDGAPLTHLWRAARADGRLPNPDEVEHAREQVALPHEAGADAYTDTFSAALAGSECGFDLGGIAKGYAAKQCLATLAREGITSALVDLGGDLALGEPPPGRTGWRIRAGSGDPDRSPVLELARCAVATSGSTEQYLDADGRRFGHIVDPRTGWPVQHARVVTVVHPAAYSADALATIASILPLRRAEALVEAAGGRLIVEHPDSRPIFDGESLAGWSTSGGRYDGAARWTVEPGEDGQGELVGRTGENGEGGLIYTDTLHSAFELEFEVVLDYPYDSGVFTNMLPPSSGLKGLQVTLDHRPGGEIAGIYADGWLEHNPEAEQHFRKNAWNRVRVRQTGFDPRVEVWINDVKVTDYQLPADAPGFARHGRIGLQVHGADAEAASRSVRFRRLFLRELPVLPEELAVETVEPAPGVRALSEDAREAGWVDLLANGLAGFETRGSAEGYAIERGVLLVPADGGGELVTTGDHGDFELRIEFALAEMGNSGLYLRGARDGQNPSYQGYEVQILDDFHWEERTGSTLLPYQRTGGLYAVHPPATPKTYRPPGEWNRYEVRFVGQRLAVALNGLILYDLDLSEVEADPPTAERPTRGFLGVQRYGADSVEGDVSLRVRNWFVRELR